VKTKNDCNGPSAFMGRLIKNVRSAVHSLQRTTARQGNVADRVKKRNAHARSLVFAAAVERLLVVVV
jgi:hypothetical protein